MKRFEPSLLDKLFDDEPHRPAASALRQLSIEELKATVARDVEALLNTRISATDESLKQTPECERSVLTYGLRDFSAMSLASHTDREEICSSIKNAIARHEPRLQAVEVALEVRANSRAALYFAIKAMLVVHPADEPVSFDAMLHAVTLRYSVNRSKASDLSDNPRSTC